MYAGFGHLLEGMQPGVFTSGARITQAVAKERTAYGKQYELGELTQTNHSNYEYWDKPSEIEAHGREVGLFITWAEQNNVAHKKWTQI